MGWIAPYRVKMSLVTAAMLYSSRRALHKASIRAVLPDPTGLIEVVSHVRDASQISFQVGTSKQSKSIDLNLRRLISREKINLPSNTNGKSPILPVAPLNQRHLTVNVRARAVQDLVGVAMAIEGIIMRVADATVVGVRVGHYI